MILMKTHGLDNDRKQLKNQNINIHISRSLFPLYTYVLQCLKMGEKVQSIL